MTKRTPLTAQDIRDRLTDSDRKCLEAVRKDVRAREALRFLAQKAGWPEEGMCLLFVETARVSADQTAKNEPGPQDSTPEAVVKFASRLLRAALAVRTMNRQNFWQAEHPAKWSGMMPVYPHEVRAAQKDFKELPRVLSLYAQSLRLKAESTLRRRKTYRKIKNSHVRAELELINKIERLTGRPHYDKIASILGVLNPMFDLHWTAPDTLRKRAERYRDLF